MLTIKKIFPQQPHPNLRLQKLWDWMQLALLLLPFSSLLGSIGIWIVAMGVWRQQASKIVRRPLNWGFAGLGMLMLLSAVCAYQPTDALLGLFNFLPFFLVFAALSELIQTPAQLRRLAWIWVVAAVPVVTIGFGQQFWGWAGQIQVLWIVVDWVIDPTGNPPGRMASIFFYANVLASYLVVTFILSLGLWIEAVFGEKEPETPAEKQPSRSLFFGLSQPRTLRTLLLSGIVLGNAIALVLTDSRNVWAIAVLACLAYAVYLGWHWLLAGVIAVSSSVLGAAFGPSPLKEWLRQMVPAFFWARLTDQLYPDRPVAQLRTTQWKFAWALTQQRPWTGWGLRNFSSLYQSQMHLYIGHPHNLLLMLTAETGIPIALLFLALVGWIVFRGVRLLQRFNSGARSPAACRMGDRLTLFSYLTTFLGCTLFNLLDITLFDVRINLIGWLLLAAICGLIYHESTWKHLPQEHRNGN